jgi:hypothetical protein
MCSFATQQQQRQSCSSTERYTCSFCSHCPRQFERPLADGWGEEDPMHGHLILPILRLRIIFFTAMWNIKRRVKGWISWMNTKHGSLQHVQRLWQMLEYSCSSWQSLWSVSHIVTFPFVCKILFQLTNKIMQIAPPKIQVAGHGSWVVLRHVLSSLLRILWSWFRIPPRAWMFGVCVVCAFFCVCVQVEALRRTDHPSKESYRLS